MKITFKFVPFPREIWDEGIELSQAEFRLLGWFCSFLKFGKKALRFTDHQIINGIDVPGHKSPKVGLSLNSFKTARDGLLAKNFLTAQRADEGGGRGNLVVWHYTLNLSDDDDLPVSLTPETCQENPVNLSDLAENTGVIRGTIDLKERYESKHQEVEEALEPTPEPTTTSTPSSDRNEAWGQREERMRLAEQRKAEKDANKNRGLRSYPKFDRKHQAKFEAKESTTEARARKNAELLSGLSIRDGIREALLLAGEAFRQDLTLNLVRMWEIDLKPFSDDLVIAAFTEFRQRGGQWFPKPAEIITILERMSKPVKETALERQQRENQERRARNAQENTANA